MNHDPTITLEDLPQNNFIYVVINYGPIVKNTGLASDIPIVKVYVKRVENGKLLSQEETWEIGLSELNRLRIGTIWQNQSRLEGYWTNFSKPYEEKRTFTFDLLENKASSLIYVKKKNDKGGTHLSPIPYKGSDFEGLDRNDIYHSTLTKLVTKDGVTVLVPSLEFYISTYVPRNQLIKNELVMNPHDIVLQNNVENCIYTDGIYRIELKKNLEKETVCFLAYLACNNIARANISRIWSSLAIGDSLSEKHPIILPYHPKNLSFKASGIWLDSNVFFVQRIYEVRPPDEIPIRGTIKSDAPYTSANNIDNNNHPTLKLNKHPINNNTKITRRVNPGATAGIKYIVSEVSPNTENLDIEIETVVEGTIDVAPGNYSNSDKPAAIISSGKIKGGQESEDIGRAQYVGDETSDDSSRLPLMQEIENALEELHKEGAIVDLQYIDNMGKEHNTHIYCRFASRHINLNDNKYWASGYIKGSKVKKKKSGYRKLLLVKITLEKTSPFYLLEIGRKVKSDTFYGVFFSTGDGQISFEMLEKIKYVVATNKGRYNGSNLLPFPIQNAIAFRHKWGSMKNRFLNAFQIIQDKNLLS